MSHYETAVTALANAVHSGCASFLMLLGNETKL